jgi:hypothetical protein
LEFGADHDKGTAPPGQDIHLFRSKDNPDKDLFLFDDSDIRGMHCRFGNPGTIAEGHWDGHLNFVAMLGGAKRYILMPGTECKYTAIMPGGPSSRHFGYDGSDLRTLYQPERNSFSDYNEARGVETVLQEGEVLYIPTFYMHWIVSLTPNYQCNCRSGVGRVAEEEVETVAACFTEERQRGEGWKSDVQPKRWWETEKSWHAEEEAEAVRQVRDVYGPALLQLLETGTTDSLPPVPQSDLYTVAADAAQQRVDKNGHLQRKYSQPLPAAGQGRSDTKPTQHLRRS